MRAMLSGPLATTVGIAAFAGITVGVLLVAGVGHESREDKIQVAADQLFSQIVDSGGPVCPDELAERLRADFEAKVYPLEGDVEFDDGWIVSSGTTDFIAATTTHSDGLDNLRVRDWQKVWTEVSKRIAAYCEQRD